MTPIQSREKSIHKIIEGEGGMKCIRIKIDIDEEDYAFFQDIIGVDQDAVVQVNQ